MKCYQPDYPRPQLVRKNWESLNGPWGFAFDDEDKGLKEKWYLKTIAAKTIQVPFAFQTAASGINDPADHQVVWYQRSFSVDLNKLSDKRQILLFEGCDYQTAVWVNGQQAGWHTGGYDRFSFDITDLLTDGANILTVRVFDSYDQAQPRGKQRSGDTSYGCWYIPTTGIWKTVWLEQVDPAYLSRFKMTPSVKEGCFDFEFELSKPAVGCRLIIAASFEDQLKGRLAVDVDSPQMKGRLYLHGQELYDWDLKLWSPYFPNLYDLTFTLVCDDRVCDEVLSYGGLRDVRTDNGSVLIDGMPMYQRLILDQGYWPATGMTAPDEKALIADLDKAAALGYNGLRLHQKIEDERMLYWCDVKGMMVYSEMAAAYEFSDRATAAFMKQWIRIVRQNYNHPSIITWVPFNESWGVRQIRSSQPQQAFTQAVYHLTKSLDQTRPVISNDGWDHTTSDIITLHDYLPDGAALYQRYTDFKDDIINGRMFHCGDHAVLVPGFGYHGQPVVISEFGGIAMAGAEGWGYGDTVKSEEEFLSRFDSLVTAIKKLPYVAGYCYTQLSDVQQEVNGLLDQQHEFKIDAAKIRAINMRPVGANDSYMKR